MTPDHPETTVADRRTEPRQPLSEEVKVRVLDPIICGPGENVSPEGLFFVLEGAVPVEVWLPGEDTSRRGELVRVQQLGDNKTGIAVRLS